MKQRIYTDTSVIGGCFDKEFSAGSNALFEAFKSSEKMMLLSDLTLLELEYAPQQVKNLLLEVPIDTIVNIELDDESEKLASRYIEENVITEKSYVDAQHIAIATIHRADVLVSWNFKHIVNLERIHGYNSVNLKLGYPMLEIRTPIEVLKYEH